MPLCVLALPAPELRTPAVDEQPQRIFGAVFGVTRGPPAAAEPLGVKDCARMWLCLLPAVTLGGWLRRDAQGGFQTKVFPVSGGDIPGLALTLLAETCQRGARLKNHTHHSLKKKTSEKQQNHQKTSTTTTTPKRQLLPFALRKLEIGPDSEAGGSCSLLLRPDQAIPASPQPGHPRSCLSPPSQGWGQAAPPGHIHTGREALSAPPKRGLLGSAAGRASPSLAVSRPA